jgi:hypothetical protein
VKHSHLIDLLSACNYILGAVSRYIHLNVVAREYRDLTLRKPNGGISLPLLGSITSLLEMRVYIFFHASLPYFLSYAADKGIKTTFGSGGICLQQDDRSTRG